MNTTTAKPSLKALIESTNIPASLVRAVVRQMGGWESFKESAPDITRHGIDGGFHGFIYYTDTLRFAHTNRKDILNLATQQAEDFGIELIKMIEGFGCFRYSKPTRAEIVEGLAGISNESQVPNALAWYAGEEVARAYCDAFDPQ